MSGINAASSRDAWRILPTDSLEAVTLKSRQANDSFTDVAVAIAQRKPVARDKREYGEAIATQQTLTWQLWDTTGSVFATNIPKPGDRVQDASGVTWEILTANRIQFGACWDCECLRDIV